MTVAPKTKEEVYTELGERIFEEMPYAYDENEVPQIDLTQQSQILDVSVALDESLFKKILVDGPARAYGGKDQSGYDRPKVKTDDQGSTQVSVASMRDKPWESLWWSFDGGQYRVTKALMIPYTMTDDTGVKQQRHFLIGFMGVDSNG